MTKSLDLDSYDRSILREMQADASRPVEELADRIGLSRNACWRRVKRLEETGVIRAKVALVDPAKLNIGLSVLIMVRTNRHEADWAEKFRLAVRGIPEIVSAWRTAGEIDYVLRARIPDVAAYDLLYQRLIARIDMSDVSASFVMEEIKEETALPLHFV